MFWRASWVASPFAHEASPASDRRYVETVYFQSILLYVSVSIVRLHQRSSSGELRRIKIIYELKKGDPRDSVYGPYWTRLGKGSG
jgi:hypothetical protein